MTVHEFADSMDTSLIVRCYPNQKNRFVCSFERAEIKGDGILISDYGTGKSLLSALRDYVKRIRGKTLVFNAYSSSRREVVVPKDLSVS